MQEFQGYKRPQPLPELPFSWCFYFILYHNPDTRLDEQIPVQSFSKIYPFTYKEIELFVHKDYDNRKKWTVSERRTGLSVLRSDEKSAVMRTAMNKAVKKIKKYGMEKTKQKIEEECVRHKR